MTVTVRPDRTNQLVLLALVASGLAALCWVLLGAKATVIGIGLPVAVAAAIYTVRRPVVMACVMVAVEVTNLAGVASDYSSVPVFRAVLGLGLLTVLYALRDEEMRARLNRGTVIFVALVACYPVTQFLAALGSQNVDLSMSFMTADIADCIFIITVFVLAQLSGRLWTVAATFVVPLAVLSALTLVNQVVFGGSASFGGFSTVTTASGELVTTVRFGGPLPDSNFWGRHLILGLPFAAALTARAMSAGRRAVGLGWAGAILLLLVGVYLTQSRGTLITTAVVLCVWVVMSGRRIRRMGLYALPAVALVAFIPGIGNRLLALVGDVSQAGVNSAVDPSVLGRIAAQEIAWAMFRDRPLFGFGPGTYADMTYAYGDLVPTAVPEPTNAAHNLYAQMASESGIVGLVGWIALVAGVLLWLAVTVFRLPSDDSGQNRMLAVAAFAAIVGYSLASVFLHLAYFRTFGVVLALAAATAAGSVAQQRPRRIDAVRVWSGVLAVVVGAGVSAAMLAVTASPTSTASQRLALLPADRMEQDYLYALDMRSRNALLPTYARLLVPDRSGVSAVADNVRGAITVSATNTDAAAARSDLQRALDQAVPRLRDFGADTWYKVVPLGDVEQASGSRHSLSELIGSGGIGVGMALATLLAARLLLPAPRRREVETAAETRESVAV